MKSVILSILSLIILLPMPSKAQNSKADKELPYYEIPAYPEEYSQETILARVIDGLGYRYYWATEGLREEDLAYNPGNEGRSTGETLNHILGLTNTVLNACLNVPNIRSSDQGEMSWEDKRKKSLLNIKRASDHLKSGESDKAEDLKIISQRGERTSELPLWNLLNGHLADAIYHCGQIASFRRSSGNPMNPGVNVLSGKTRE